MIEKLYNKIKDIEPFDVVCDRSKIELHDNKGLRIDLTGRMGFDISVEVKKKCSFSGFFSTESSFVWHMKDDLDSETLIARLKKIQQTSVDGGPYGFSKRSTYIKRKHQMPFAMSGNFVTQASVKKIVVIGEEGIILDDISVPGRDPWFMIETYRPANHGMGRGRGGGGPMTILYNMEHWWPVKPARDIYFKELEVHATSVLTETEGKLLTMHDKFVIDLAVKLFNENREE